MQIGEIKTKDLVFYGGTLVAIVFFFTNIKQDLALQTQKTDYLIAQVEKISTTIESQNGKIGQHDIDITTIKKDIDFLGKAQGIPVSTTRSQPSASAEDSRALASRSSQNTNLDVKVEKEKEPQPNSERPPSNFDDDENEIASVKVPAIVSDVADALTGN